MRSGSATISRTVIRGFSDAYGSWKTICMSRRTGRICFRLYAVMSAPLKTIFPPVGSVSLMIVRPERRLAAARLADDPERLPAEDTQVDTVHSTHLADRVLEHARLDREPLDEALDAEDLVGVGGSGVDGRRRPLLSLTTRPLTRRQARAGRRPPRRSGRRRRGRRSRAAQERRYDRRRDPATRGSVGGTRSPAAG